MSEPLPPPEECAQCGADIPPRARACPECGADERTGWRESSLYDGLDLPEDEDTSPVKPAGDRRVNGVAWYWWVVAVILLCLLGLYGLSFF